MVSPFQNLGASPLCTSTIKYGHSEATGTSENKICVFRFPGYVSHPERSGKGKENVKWKEK